MGEGKLMEDIRLIQRMTGDYFEYTADCINEAKAKFPLGSINEYKTDANGKLEQKSAEELIAETYMWFIEYFGYPIRQSKDSS